MTRLTRRTLALSLPLALALSAALTWSPAGAVGVTVDTISMAPAPSPSSPVVYGTSVTLSATVGNTASPAGTVDFKYSTDGSTYVDVAGCSAQSIATGSSVVSTCVTTALPAGVQDVEAVYSGDATYESVTSTPVAYSVTKHASTISVTSALPAAPVAPGTSVTITATVGAGQTAGTVQFNYSLDGATYVTVSGCGAKAVSGTTATCVTTALPIGTQDLNAAYLSDPNYSNQTSVAFAYTVKTGATVSLGATPASPVPAGTSVAVTATVGAGQTGTVTVKASPDGVTYSTIAACSAVAISGTTAVCTTTTIPAGTLDLEAVYNGDSNYSTATSAALPYTVTGSTAGSVTLTATPSGPVAFNTPVTLTANLGSSLQTGTVLFASSLDGTTYTTIAGCSAVAIAASRAACTTSSLPVGTRFVRATYSGNATYSSLNSGALAMVVSGTTPSSVALVAAPASPVAVGTSVTLTATVGLSAESGTVAFQYSTDGSSYLPIAACTAQPVSTVTASCVTTALPAGTLDVRAVYSGNPTYAPATSAVLAYAVAGSTTSSVTVAATPVTPGARARR